MIAVRCDGVGTAADDGTVRDVYSDESLARAP